MSTKQRLGRFWSILILAETVSYFFGYRFTYYFILSFFFEKVGVSYGVVGVVVGSKPSCVCWLLLS